MQDFLTNHKFEFVEKDIDLIWNRIDRDKDGRISYVEVSNLK